MLFKSVIRTNFILKIMRTDEKSFIVGYWEILGGIGLNLRILIFYWMVYRRKTFRQ